MYKYDQFFEFTCYIVCQNSDKIHDYNTDSDPKPLPTSQTKVFGLESVEIVILSKPIFFVFTFVLVKGIACKTGVVQAGELICLPDTARTIFCSTKEVASAREDV